MAVPQIPTLLLTGYLGSGKTTLVNKILNNRKGIKFAVIVNDLGEVNIDADLIEKGGVVGQGDDSLMALQNGCICCTLKMDLVKQLSELTAMKRFDYIVIEASGICEPEPIAQTLCTYPRMGYEFYKDGLARLGCKARMICLMRPRSESETSEALFNKMTLQNSICWMTRLSRSSSFKVLPTRFSPQANSSCKRRASTTVTMQSNRASPSL